MRDKIAEIELSNGMVAICDISDFGKLQGYTWYAHRRGNTWYASATTRIDGKRKMIHMHRLLMGKTPDNKEIDHIDGDGLNNSKTNLRIVSHQENCMNTRLSKNKSSKYKGVYWHKNKRKYLACVWINRKHIFIGYFNNEQAAAKAYNKKVYGLFGGNAYLNPIGD